MRSEFAIKNKPFLTLKTEFFKKSHVFPKELAHAFGQEMPIFSLFRFGQNKTRNNA